MRTKDEVGIILIIMKKICFLVVFQLQEQGTGDRHMKPVINLFVIALSVFALIFPALAQGVIDKETQIISELNRFQPLQNPRYEQSEETLTRKLLDRKNKVIGNVNDVIVSRVGTVVMLEANFSRLQLSTPVYLNYSDLKIEPRTRGYILGFDEKEVAGFYPNLLAQTQTASGDDNENLSIRRIEKVDVNAADGRIIGHTGSILFSADGQRAEAVYVSLTTGILRGEGVAVPFPLVTFAENGGTMRASISNAMADAMIKFASQ
jgi:hypothetical protein